MCVRELEMSVCLWLEDVCKLKKNQGILKKVRKISDFGGKQEKIMDGEKGKKIKDFRRRDKKSRISENGKKIKDFRRRDKKSRISDEGKKK